jgi:serine/threonine protein kinase
MEYMDGGHLGERIDGMSTLQRLWTAIAVTEGVRYAHKRGVAHLDIKPQNILFRSVPDAWDVPKLADWGLSSHLLEHTKSVEGMSPQYAAPEQFDEEYGTVDDRTDIYQLGAVFYELFTGSPPFTGRPTRVMRGVLEEEPRPPSAIADVPSGIDTVLLTALSKRKSNRYEDILYLRDALTDVLKHTCGGQEGTRSADEDTDDSGPHSTTRTRDRDSSADTVSDDERSRFGTRPAQERSDGIIVEVSAIFTNLDVTELVVYTEQDRITTTVLLWEVDNQSETTASWGNRAINCVLDDRVKQRPDVSPSGDIVDTDRLTGGYEFAPGPGTTAELEPGVKARWINTIDLPPERTIDRVFVDGYDHEKLSIPIDESVVAANDTFPFN